MEKGSFNFDQEKNRICQFFFFMSLQIVLYQGLAGLYEELSTIQIKVGNIWNTPRDMMIYIYINIFICAEQLINLDCTSNFKRSNE